MSEPRPTVHISTAGDILAMIPSLVGYQLDSKHVAVLGMIDDRLITFTAAIDWEDNDPADVAMAIERAATTSGADQLLVVGYGPQGATRARAFGAMSAQVNPGLSHHEMHINEGQYVLLDHPRARWRPMPEPPADLAVLGRPPAAATREEMRARYAPLDQPTIDPLAGDQAVRLDRLSPSLRIDIARRSLDRIAARAPKPFDAAQVAHLVQDRDVRGSIIVHAYPSSARTEALVQVYRGAPVPHRPVLGSAAGAALYLSGRQAQADAVLEHAGDERLAGLITAAIRAGVPPDRVSEILARTVPEGLRSADEEWTRQTEPTRRARQRPEHPDLSTIPPPMPDVGGPEF
ncbi:hypothetical protein OCAE111667_26760 [Occultella aeris]|uniref:DUF4192 domain-containing protein n=1 Tax=Occultella aeris TaxID=2761496 RepID=A0A7M4DJS5_9MICO|nr:hypothetical protein [Occultella aeris]VZO37310.1 hypothetical protein HALOF300_02383 [Occultella aeris]